MWRARARAPPPAPDRASAVPRARAAQRRCTPRAAARRAFSAPRSSRLTRPGPQARRRAVLARESARHCRARRHLLPPRDQARAAFAYGPFWKHALHRHAAIGIEIDVRERVLIACNPGGLRELLFHLVHRKEDLLRRVGEIRLAETGACRAPFPALIGQRNVLHQPLELVALDTARDDADHAVPAVYRDIVHHLLVTERSEERRVGKECRSRW